MRKNKVYTKIDRYGETNRKRDWQIVLKRQTNKEIDRQHTMIKRNREWQTDRKRNRLTTESDCEIEGGDIQRGGEKEKKLNGDKYDEPKDCT
jgi:hypothetical protein